MKNILLLVLSPLILSACQVMTATECQHANWTALGQQDGFKGYTPRVYSRVDACLKHGTVVASTEIEKYQLAYKSAIQQYCQPDHIYQLSIIGEARIYACPEPDYSRVKAIYDVGSRYYQNKVAIENVRDRIDELDDKIDATTDKDAQYKLLEEQRKKSKELTRLLDEQFERERELKLIKP